MSGLKEIKELYDAYIENVENLERNRKFTAGLLGLAKGPKDDPCHDQFAKDLETAISEFAASDPDPEEVYALLNYMYSIPLKYRDNNIIYWMLAAVHTLAFDLISCLRKEDAVILYDQYNCDYPRRERLPAQKKTLKALKDKSTAR